MGETLEIISNGSKWCGQDPDTIEVLLDVLKRETLDPRFEWDGNFVLSDGKYGTVRVFGNFLTVSHVFNIRGSYESLQPLIDAIRANQQTKAYTDARRGMKLPRRPQKIEVHDVQTEAVAMKGETGGHHGVGERREL